MKKFDSYEELLQDIGVTFSSHIKYAKKELTNFLECEGSNDIDDDIMSIVTFNLLIEDENIDNEIGVLHDMDEEDNIKYTYVLFE